jgi:hypothetical protein
MTRAARREPEDRMSPAQTRRESARMDAWDAWLRVARRKRAAGNGAE